MHMWMWFGYDLGEFLFPGLEVNSRWAFALTWILLFFIALLFEASKVFLAKAQREAHKRLFPYRSDERRNLLCERDREQGAAVQPSTSRNTSTAQVSRWDSIRTRALVNLCQTLVFLVHNVVGYLLMLVVMVYNVHLLLAVVFGMMLGYFLFGTKLTQLQMQCFGTKRVVICTPECDDTADSSTPPLLNSSTEVDVICQTRTCIQPSHYFPATSLEGTSSEHANATCYYGAKRCPSKVARIKKMQLAGTSQYCSGESEKEDSPSVEDVQLLRTERQGCCKKKQEPLASDKKCCGMKSSHIETAVVHANEGIEEIQNSPARENSPQITCCHNTSSAPSDSQEQIVK